MSIINQADQAREILRYYQDEKISIPCFCAENTFTMEGILRGAAQVAKKSGKNPALYIAVTANYHGRQQLRNYTSQDSTEEGYLAFRNDLERLCRHDGPFANVQVIPALDHGQPDLDEWLIDKGRDFWGCVMFDCSTKPLEENQQMVHDFVSQYKDCFVIEGCVDEITEAGQGGVKLTDPQQAKIYMDSTGADLIVANLGTEHRVTGEIKKYHSDLARKIFQQIGHKIVLHGTSCLKPEDLIKLRKDGIAKVNIWTILEISTSQKMLVEMIKCVNEILPESEITALKQQGLLADAVTNLPNHNPKLECLTEVYRRNQIKVPSITKMVDSFMTAFGYCD